MDDAALAQIIRSAQRGEPVAFDRLVELFAPRIAGFLYRMTGSRQDSEDLAQEVFLRLVRMIGVYEHDGRFEPWLFRIAANLARDRIRRAARTPGFIGESDSAGRGGNGGGRLRELPAGPAAVDAGLVLTEELDELDAALAQLPETEREVIMLRHFSEMSFKEIAAMTGTPLGTALARAHRGLTHLREIMSGGASEAEGLRDHKISAGKKVG